jgi:hypothetical protein
VKVSHNFVTWFSFDENCEGKSCRSVILKLIRHNILLKINNLCIIMIV